MFGGKAAGEGGKLKSETTARVRDPHSVATWRTSLSRRCMRERTGRRAETERPRVHVPRF